LIPAARISPEEAGHGNSLYRSTSDRRIAGVCGGLAEYLAIDSTVVRVIAVIVSVYPGAVIGGVVVYAIAWLLIPLRQARFTPATT
jgi:phage shock protein C